MAMLKCKMCGGELSFEEGASVCECEYCGSKQTLPKQDDEKKLKLFDRANRLRFNCEFDKAGQIYEQIISDFPEEAEAYWGNLLCKYGIEYVDDPATGDKVPTCHRSSFDSFMQDDDFEQVMENSDTLARGVYRAQAKQIEEIRKGIIEVSGKEQPYDIFICYKETDENGGRTLDSVLAQDVYGALTEKGYRVFFSRISLEDKLGTEYEPYIFAALNSAKVMLAFGTSYDYYNAVWVKNEWSRYLKLMAKDKTKHLIPCFKNIDAYDMPKEFARLQAQDMGKVGAVQDLVRGVEKLCRKDMKAAPAQPAQPASAPAAPGVESYLTRVFMFLGDGDWKSADEYCEKVLDIDPRCGEAYLGKLLAQCKKPRKEDLLQENSAFYESPWFAKAQQFGTPALVQELEELAAGNREMKKENIRIMREKQEHLADMIAATVSTFEAENKRNALETKRASLLQKETVCVDAQSAAKAAKREEKACAEEIKRLEARRNSLGLFAGKEKKEIDAKVAELQQKQAKAKSKEDEAIKNAVPLKQLRAELDTAEKEFAELQTEKPEHAVLSGPELCEAIQNEKVFGSYISRYSVKETEKQKLLEYAAARMLMNKGDYKSAFHKLNGLRGYLDVDSLLANDEILSAAAAAVVRDAAWQPGKYVTFGTYPHTKAGSDSTPIEWRVLARDGDKALIISRYGLDCKPYNKVYGSVTWENCTLRTWLNGEFLNKAFTASEQANILITHVTADRNPSYSTDPGNATEDRVFLLSIPEVNKYFTSNKDRLCVSTTYAKAHGAWTSADTCYWWLRSPGKFQYIEAYVYGGGVDHDGYGADSADGCVRPAIWVKIF